MTAISRWISRAGFEPPHGHGFPLDVRKIQTARSQEFFNHSTRTSGSNPARMYSIGMALSSAGRDLRRTLLLITDLLVTDY
jgi:hypothetical protein